MKQDKTAPDLLPWPPPRKPLEAPLYRPIISITRENLPTVRIAPLETND